MDQALNPCRKTLLVRLSVILFFAELAHGMLLYGIVPDLVQYRFPAEGLKLFGVIPLKEEVAALCLAAYTLAELAAKVWAGHQVDRHGPDVPVRLGLILSLVTVPVVLLSKDPNVMVLGAFFHGIGAAPIWPAVISSWTRGRSAEERGEIMGQILTGWMAGLGSGLIAGKFLVGLSGRAEVVVTYTPVALWVIALVAALWSRQRLGVPALHGMDEDDVAHMRAFPPELKIMGIGLFLQNLAFGALILPFNFLAEQHFHLNTVQVGLLFLLGGGPTVLLLHQMGKVADRIGRRNSVIWSMFVVAPLIAVGPFLSYLKLDAWALFGIMIPGLIIAGIAYATLLPAWHALALGRIPEHQRGRSLALLMSVEMAALAGGHALGTPIYTKVSFAAPFLVAGITFGVLAVIYSLGYILPHEAVEEPHRVQLDAVRPLPDKDAGGTPTEGPLRTPGSAPPASSPPPRSGE